MTSPTAAAGGSTAGSRNTSSTPSARPASPSMSPSWPAPITPTVVIGAGLRSRRGVAWWVTSGSRADCREDAVRLAAPGSLPLLRAPLHRGGGELGSDDRRGDPALV